MRFLPRLATILVSATIGGSVLAGCGETQTVKPKAIAFEPTIVGCSGNVAECTKSATEARFRAAHQASSHLCPANKPYLLVKADGTLVCLATLPSAGPTGIGVPVPSAVRWRGASAIGEFATGEAVAAQSGCLACHRIGEAGNPGPGPELTHVAARLPAKAIERALVVSPAPMPSFSHLPEFQRRALVYFLAQLR